MTLNDGFFSPHSPLYALPQRRWSPALIWGTGIALLVHALALVWLIQSQFTPALQLPLPAEAPPTQVELYKLPPPPTQVIKKPETPIPLHKTQAPIPLAQEVIPVAPSEPTGQVQLPTPPATLMTAEAPAVTAPVSEAPAYIQARWTRFPDAQALSQYYPAKALDNEREGVAKVECTIMDVQGRVKCLVLSESPTNQGFGAATVKMVEAEGRVDTSAGAIAAGSRLVTTVRWSLN